MSNLLPAVPVALTLAGVAFGCGADMPEVPANPTYTKDVAPILNAHCVRCHGADNMLHQMPIKGTPMTPATCYLQRYEDDCSVTPCKVGVGNASCAQLINLYINAARDTLQAMPPLPSEALNDWEKEVIARWTMHGTPQ